MRRSPFDDYEVRVSVDELTAPTPWANLQSSLSSVQAMLAGRWMASDLGALLQRRATVHVTVLALAVSITAGGALLAPHLQDEEQTAVSAAAATDSLTLMSKTAITARAIPLNTSGDALYTVQAGETLSSIARAVGVNEEALLAFNGFSSSDALNVGLQLRIPDLAKVPPEQLRIRDTAPHEGSPSIEAPLPPQKASPGLTVRAVQKGDTAGALAAAAGVSESSVLASNNLQKDTVLNIGQTLVIPSMNGRLVATKPGDTVSALAAAYSGTIEGIIAANKLDPRTQALAGGQLVLVPSDPDVGAAIIKDIPAATVSTPTNTLTTPAITTTPAKPIALPLPANAPGFSWPAPGAITTYFSGWHNGIDIANSTGTPVRAVQAGRVVQSGWDNSGYGYMIRIDHGNGLQSLYGHASKLIARAGQYVDKGEVVMLMGSTGRSTGPHVHFSVFRGGAFDALNPLRYLP